MIDAFAIMTTHLLLLVAFWRLRGRDALDDEVTPGAEQLPTGFAPPRLRG